MKNLAKEATREFIKKLTKFIGLILFIIGSVLTFTALFSAVFQVKNSLNNIKKNSINYQYEIKIDSLNIDNNVWKKNSNWKINKYNRDFLSQFYNDEKIDSNHLTFNNIYTDILGLNCDLTNNNICTWIKQPKYLNLNTGTASFTSLVKNFNNSLSSTFLSYIFFNSNKNNSNNIFKNKKNNFDISFNISYQFIDNNLTKKNQYFNATAINKEKNLLFYDNSWRNNSIFYSSFNNLFEIINKKIIFSLTENDIILNKQYADYNNLKIGKQFNLGNNKKIKFNIVGYGAKYNNIYPDLISLSNLTMNNKNIDLKNGSILFMNNNNFNLIKNNFLNGTEKITGFIRINDNLPEQQRIILLRKFLSNYFIAPDNAIISFDSSLSGQVIKLTNAGFIINTSIAISCSIIILIIIAFFIKKDIDNQKKQIGVLKSLGYCNFELSFIFTFNIIFITLISCLIGWIFSIPLQMYFTSSNLYSIGIPLSLFYFNPFIFISTIIIIPFIFILISLLISFIILKQNTLNLIYDLKEYNFNCIVKKIKKENKFTYFRLTFNIYLSFIFAIKSFGKWITVLIVLSFSSFLLIFQLDASIMAQDIIKNSFRYFKNDIKSYLIVTYDQQDIAQETNNGKTYNWISVDEREKYYHEAKILDNNETFNFPNPLICFTNLLNFYNKIDIKKNCGDLLNIIGDPNESSLIKSKINYNSISKTYPYLTSKTINAIINYKIKNSNFNKLTNGWNNLLNIINFIKPILIKKGINESDIQIIINGINFINNLSMNANNQYPDIYLGPYMIYDKNYDFPYIFLPANWNSNDYKNFKNPISQLNIVGISNKKIENSKLLNYCSKTTTFDDVQKKVFNYKINNKPINNNLNFPINEPIPVILSKKVFQSINLDSKNTFKLNVKITNSIGYVPVIFKVIGSNDADISSGNIYMNQNSIITLMNQWVKLTKKGKEFSLNSYYNVIASKMNSLGITLQPYRIMSLFSLTDNYNFTIFNKNKKFDFNNIHNLKTNLKLLNGFNKIWPFDALRENYLKGMHTVKDVINVLECLTIIIIILILTILVSMIIDENYKIILYFKIIGYQIWKIILIVLGFYLLAIIIGYILSYVIVRLLWSFIANIIFKSTGILLIPSLSFFVVSITTLLICFILILVIGVGIWKIKKNKLVNNRLK